MALSRTPHDRPAGPWALQPGVQGQGARLQARLPAPPGPTLHPRGPALTGPAVCRRLPEVELLRPFSAAFLDDLSARLHSVGARRGDAVARRGQCSGCCFVVCEGSVELRGGAGGEALAVLGAGQLAGANGLVGTPSPVDASAASDCELLALHADDLQAVATDHPAELRSLQALAVSWHGIAASELPTPFESCTSQQDRCAQANIANWSAEMDAKVQMGTGEREESSREQLVPAAASAHQEEVAPAAKRAPVAGEDERLAAALNSTLKQQRAQLKQLQVLREQLKQVKSTEAKQTQMRAKREGETREVRSHALIRCA